MFPIWLNLALWNNAEAALAECKGAATGVENGRRWCAPALWVEAPSAGKR